MQINIIIGQVQQGWDSISKVSWAFYVSVIFLFVVALLVWSLEKSRKKVSRHFLRWFMSIFVVVNILDIGISTPITLNKCIGAYETNDLLRVLFYKIGAWAYPTTILFNMIMVFSALTLFSFISNIPKKDYRRGFIMGIFFILIISLAIAHVSSMISNLNLC